MFYYFWVFFLFFFLPSPLCAQTHSPTKDSVFSENADTAKFVDFYLYDVPGESVQLSQIKKDKSALLVFWAMWSPDCRKLLDQLQDRLEAYNAAGIVVIAINVDRNSKRLSLYVDQKQYKFTVLKDPQGIFEDLYETYMLPANILIDKENRIVYRGHRLPEPGEMASEKA